MITRPSHDDARGQCKLKAAPLDKTDAGNGHGFRHGPVGVNTRSGLLFPVLLPKMSD